MNTKRMLIYTATTKSFVSAPSIKPQKLLAIAIRVKIEVQIIRSVKECYSKSKKKKETNAVTIG